MDWFLYDNDLRHQRVNGMEWVEWMDRNNNILFMNKFFTQAHTKRSQQDYQAAQI